MKKRKHKGRIKLQKYSALRKEAWRVQSIAIRKEEKVCFTCGKQGDWKEMHAGHFIHKNALDFFRINIHCQCSYCNTYLHGNLTAYTIKMIDKYGRESVDELLKMKREIHKYTRDELNYIIKIYKEKK